MMERGNDYKDRGEGRGVKSIVLSNFSANDTIMDSIKIFPIDKHFWLSLFSVILVRNSFIIIMRKLEE